MIAALVLCRYDCIYLDLSSTITTSLSQNGWASLYHGLKVSFIIKLKPSRLNLINSVSEYTKIRRIKIRRNMKSQIKMETEDDFMVIRSQWTTKEQIFSSNANYSLSDILRWTITQFEHVWWGPSWTKLTMSREAAPEDFLHDEGRRARAWLGGKEVDAHVSWDWPMVSLLMVTWSSSKQNDTTENTFFSQILTIFECVLYLWRGWKFGRHSCSSRSL